MRTINQVTHLLTDAPAIVKEMVDTIRGIDTEFHAEEVTFRNAVLEMEEKLDGKVVPSASEYLAAMESSYAAEVSYIMWQGFCLNLAIFKNPVNALLLNGDYDDLCHENLLGRLPTVQKAFDTINAFYEAIKSIPNEEKEAVDAVISFYSYLETTGYKLAHYYGFRLADKLLEHLVLGYFPNDVNTTRYRMELEDYLQVNLGLLE